MLSLPIVRLELVERDAEEAEYEAVEWPWLQRMNYDIIEEDNRVVGFISLWSVDRNLMPHSFHSCMDEVEQELSSFALIVCDRKGRLRPHLTTSLTLTGSTITFLSELSIAKEFRGMGYGSSALRALWAAEGTGDADHIFTSPATLQHEMLTSHLRARASQFHFLHSPRRLSPCGFWTKNGFTRVGTTQFFCAPRPSTSTTNSVEAPPPPEKTTHPTREELGTVVVGEWGSMEWIDLKEGEERKKPTTATWGCSGAPSLLSFLSDVA